MKVNVSPRAGLQALGMGVMIAAMLSACGAVTTGSSTADSDLPVVRFGATQSPSSIGTVAAVIEQEKLDEACGINIEAQSFSPDAADIALLSGKTDVGYFGYNSWASSKEKLEKLAMLAPLQAEHGSLFVAEDSPATSLQDLRGKRIALLPPVSGQYQDFAMLVAKMGYDLEQDFETVTAPPPAIEAFLKRGEVDAAIVFEPNATNLTVEGGFRPILNLNDKWESITGDPLYMLGISANKSWLSGHRKEAECAVTAVRKATDMLATDASVYEGLREIVGAQSKDHLTQLRQNLGAIYTRQTSNEATPAIRSQLEQAQELRLIPSVPDPIFNSMGD